MDHRACKRQDLFRLGTSGGAFRLFDPASFFYRLLEAPCMVNLMQSTSCKSVIYGMICTIISIHFSCPMMVYEVQEEEQA